MPNFFLDFRWTDAIDIIVVAALVYFAIVWIRSTSAAMVAGGLVILGALYVAAQALGLQLTAWIFQGFFAIFVVIVVVIFQEELRQLFEQVALISLGRSEKKPVAADTAQILVSALADCARDRIGALVVLPGRQPIARHVRGGVPLNGAVSIPLIKSLFDPHSPGHDGAVVIDQGRVSEFAVHLPLSTDFEQLGGVGTRHSAALGLAELTDALCIVVSEERGKISIARGGKLRALETPHELAEALQSFLVELTPQAGRRRLLPRLLLENWIEKLAAITVVIGLWYVFVPGSRPTQATYTVRVDPTNVPSDVVIDELSPATVDVTLTGPARRFYLFDPQRLRVQLDVTLSSAGRRTFEIKEQDVSAPKEFAVERISPPKIKVSVHKEQVKEPPGTNGK